jgi:hypothetical protein
VSGELTGVDSSSFTGSLLFTGVDGLDRVAAYDLDFLGILLMDAAKRLGNWSLDGDADATATANDASLGDLGFQIVLAAAKSLIILLVGGGGGGVEEEKEAIVTILMVEFGECRCG